MSVERVPGDRTSEWNPNYIDYKVEIVQRNDDGEVQRVAPTFSDQVLAWKYKWELEESRYPRSRGKDGGGNIEDMLAAMAEGKWDLALSIARWRG